VVVDVPENQQPTLKLEGEAKMQVEASFVDLAASDALHPLDLQARVVRILGQESQRLRKFGPRLFRQETGGLREPVRVDEVHGFLRREGLRAPARNISAVIFSASSRP